MALPSSARGGARVIWVALHTAEGSRRASDLYAFFDRGQNASSHVGIDSTGFYDWVPRERYAWTLLNGNPISVNAEICGFARWTRAQWLSTGVVDGCVNPRAMVRNAAMWAKRECEALGIPKQYIGTNGVRNRQAGIIIHWDYSRGTGNGDHWDTGENFPFDVFFSDMNGGEVDDMNVSEMKSVLAGDWRPVDGRNPTDMWVEAVRTGHRIEAKLAIMDGKLSDDEANIIAAFRQAQGGLDPAQQAELIKGQVDEAVWKAIARLAKSEE